MNSKWSLQQIDHYDDKFALDWELFSLEMRPSQMSQVIRTSHTRVDEWVKLQASKINENVEKESCSASGIAILYHLIPSEIKLLESSLTSLQTYAT